MSDHLYRLDACAQAELLRRGELSALELVDATIARIEALNPALNAVIHPLFDKARAEASVRTHQAAPFAGVPMLVKDAVLQTAGDPYHMGSALLKKHRWRSAEDSELARRYRQAGFILLGKTNTPEFASSATTEPVSYGATRNPWQLHCSAGGSSGGSAAAVAAGMVALAHGNDMGGSIRIPAAFCGLVGLKPSRARNSLGPQFGEYWGMLTHEHVLTRSVRDSAAVLDASAGPAIGDPYVAPPPERPWLQEVGAPPGQLRIGVFTAGVPVASDCLQAVEHSVRLLASLGHKPEPINLPAFNDTALRFGFAALMTCAVCRDVARIEEMLGIDVEDQDLEPLNAAFRAMGKSALASDYLKVVEELQQASRRLSAWTSDWDVLLTPSTAISTPSLGKLAPHVAMDELMENLAIASHFTAPFNVTGEPAISLPLYWNSQGLPVGVQLVAPYGREDRLFRLASQLEQAQPWHQRWPEL